MALIEYLKRSIYMNLIYEDRYLLILSGLWVTLLLTISSFVLGDQYWVWPSAPARVAGIMPCAGFATQSPPSW